MALSNKTNLKSQAEVIRYEDGEGQNTAERVGKVLSDLIDNVDASLTTETTQREQKDNALQSSLNTTAILANAASETATQAKNAAITAQSTANAAKTTAEAAKQVTDSKGMPNGIAPLDAGGKVPASHLPGFVDDVVEFNSMVNGVTFQLQSSSHKSTDSGCMVVYDKSKSAFFLAVATQHLNADVSEWGTVLRPVKTNSLIAPQADTLAPSDFGVEAANKVELT